MTLKSKYKAGDKAMKDPTVVVAHVRDQLHSFYDTSKLICDINDFSLDHLREGCLKHGLSC